MGIQAGSSASSAGRAAAFRTCGAGSGNAIHGPSLTLPDQRPVRRLGDVDTAELLEQVGQVTGDHLSDVPVWDGQVGASA